MGVDHMICMLFITYIVQEKLQSIEGGVDPEAVTQLAEQQLVRLTHVYIEGISLGVRCIHVLKI